MLRAVWRPPSEIYQHLHFEGDFDVEVSAGCSFRIRAYGYIIENDLFWAGYAGNREKASMAVWRNLARRATTVLDVGANTGVYALAAKAVNQNARVIAFEPVERVFSKLRANADLNGSRIEVEELAVSDTSGRATLYDTETDHSYSSSLDWEMLGTAYNRSAEVDTTTLDGYCARKGISSVDLIKIDVERHEPAVLRGARRILRESRPSILIEILDRQIGQLIESEIAELGYRIYGVRDDTGGLDPAAEPGVGCRNFLLLRPEAVREIGAPL